MARSTAVIAMASTAALADAAVPAPPRHESAAQAAALRPAEVGGEALITHRATGFAPAPVVTPHRDQRRPERRASRSAARRQVPVDVRGCDGSPGWQQRRVDRALRSISYPWRGLGYRIDVRPAKAGYLGMTYPGQRRIVMWVRSCRTETDVMLRVTLAHEIGHAVDFTYGNEKRRARWLQLRGAEGTEWFCCGADDFTMGAGDFAEVFAYWQAGPGYYLSRVAPAPTRSQLADLIPLFWPS